MLESIKEFDPSSSKEALHFLLGLLIFLCEEKEFVEKRNKRFRLSKRKREISLFDNAPLFWQEIDREVSRIIEKLPKNERKNILYALFMPALEYGKEFLVKVAIESLVSSKFVRIGETEKVLIKENPEVYTLILDE